MLNHRAFTGFALKVGAEICRNLPAKNQACGGAPFRLYKSLIFTSKTVFDIIEIYLIISKYNSVIFQLIFDVLMDDFTDFNL